MSVEFTYKEVLESPDSEDKGSIRLVDYMGNDLSVIRAARVSHNADWRTGEEEIKDSGLINYLMKNRHTTPFEMVEFTFEVKAPIFVIRQWHRHRTWSYNEVSARYTKLDEGFYIPMFEHIGMQSKDNKQVRDLQDWNNLNQEDKDKSVSISAIISGQSKQSFEQYENLIKMGCPRELARSVLPVNAYTRMFAKVDLKNLLHFISLRSHSHAQWEIQQYSNAMLEMIEQVVPVSVSAFKKYNME